ncbi:MAG: 2-haloacid dehalogenase [Actinomycetota bacterium]|nr:2-haloacid dehalogenase [Actinomycetota bacterium]
MSSDARQRPAVRGVGARLDTGEPFTAAVFDLGAVLIEWDPRHLYRTLFADEAAMEEFLATVCTPEWNAEQDRGRTLAAATAVLVEKHPQHAELIEAYYGRWDEMLGAPIAGTVQIAHELRAAGLRLVALSNWSAETFPRARHRLTFLDEFDAVLVSGTVGLIKPDPAIYQLLIQRHDVDPAHALFVDDSAKNVEAAAAVGFDAIRFQSPDQLRADLTARGLLAG